MSHTEGGIPILDKATDFPSSDFPSQHCDNSSSTEDKLDDIVFCKECSDRDKKNVE